MRAGQVGGRLSECPGAQTGPELGRMAEGGQRWGQSPGAQGECGPAPHAPESLRNRLPRDVGGVSWAVAPHSLGYFLKHRCVIGPHPRWSLCPTPVYYLTCPGAQGKPPGRLIEWAGGGGCSAVSIPRWPVGGEPSGWGRAAALGWGRQVHALCEHLRGSVEQVPLGGPPLPPQPP